MKRDTREGQTEDHPWRGQNHYPSSTNDVNILHRNEGKQEIRPSDNESHSRWLVETNRLEKRRGIVH